MCTVLPSALLVAHVQPYELEHWLINYNAQAIKQLSPDVSFALVRMRSVAQRHSFSSLGSFFSLDKKFVLGFEASRVFVALSMPGSESGLAKLPRLTQPNQYNGDAPGGNDSSGSKPLPLTSSTI